MADIKGTHFPEGHTRQVTEFPEVKGKAVENVEISADITYYAITIRFQDKTTLTFTVEPCVAVFPALADWATGDERTLKRWQPVQSIIPKM